MKASDILGLDDLLTKVITVERWGKDVTIRELSLDEGMKVLGMADGDALTITGEDVAQIVAWGVIDDDGNRLFTDEQVPELAKKNRDALLFIYQEIMSISGDDAGKN